MREPGVPVMPAALKAKLAQARARHTAAMESGQVEVQERQQPQMAPRPPVRH